jgi:hypothetical protein
MSRGSWVLVAIAAGLAVRASPSTRAAAPRFYVDDPIAVDPEHQDAAGVKPRYLRREADYVEVALSLGKQQNVRALNVNTIDEVPDSSWYTNRIDSTRPMTAEDVGRGPAVGPGPVEGHWTIVAADHEGRALTMTARDAGGTAYGLAFDPASNPELSTGAGAVAARLLHALGYNTPDARLVHLRRDDLIIGDGAPVRDAVGRRRVMKPADLDVLLSKAARSGDGRYRAIASRALDGTDLGPFRYAGTRRDDPNDIFAHEHRRELRGLRVFCAWLNHDDAHSIDTRDFLVADGPRRLVRHYLVDFESTLGSGSTRAGRPEVANEYAWARRSELLTALTFGFHVRPRIGVVTYPDLPAVGRFEGAFFEPETWKPPYRNGAFENAGPDDAFWAARRVVAVSDDAIRAAVKVGQYADARAEAYLAQALITRRDKIGRLWLNSLLPLVECRMVLPGTLTCSNIAVERRLAEPGGEYRIRWHRFDNQTDSAQPIGDEAVTREARFDMPHDLLDGNEFVMAEIRGAHPRYPGWATPMQVYFRKTADGWLTVGVERLGSGGAGRRASASDKK